jgi:hypothetical protein
MNSAVIDNRHVSQPPAPPRPTASPQSVAYPRKMYHHNGGKRAAAERSTRNKAPRVRLPARPLPAAVSRSTHPAGFVQPARGQLIDGRDVTEPGLTAAWCSNSTRYSENGARQRRLRPIDATVSGATRR